VKLLLIPSSIIDIVLFGAREGPIIVRLQVIESKGMA
jgi:hypothetical protein